MHRTQRAEDESLVLVSSSDSEDGSACCHLRRLVLLMFVHFFAVRLARAGLSMVAALMMLTTSRSLEYPPGGLSLLYTSRAMTTVG